ncbi:hypothetical protein D3C80_1286410 [compost metagenome]
MAEGGGLGRLPMRIGHDQRGLVTLGGIDQRFQQNPRLGGERVDLVLQADLEQRVIDIVARTGRVQAAGDIDADAGFQFFLDQEEEILDFAGIDELRWLDGPVDILKRTGDLGCCFGIENAGFAQHDQMSAVYAAEAVDMVVLGAVEKRAQHGFLVDRIGKLAVIRLARVDIGHDIILSGPPASHRARCSVAGR